MTRISARARAIEPSMIRTLRDLAGPDCIDLGLGQADLKVHPDALEAAHEVLREGHAPYSPNLGLSSLREAVGERYGIGGEQVMVTCGVQEGLAVAMLGLIEPGDEVLVPDPGFPAYPNLVRAAGGVPVTYALSAQDWGLDTEAVRAAITPRTRAILVNSPGNPTGALVDAPALARLVPIILEHDLLWISDEIYEDYIYEGEHASLADFAEVAHLGVRLSGLSKSHHMMGWRIGWLTGPQELVEELKPLHQHLVTCAPTLAQRAGAAALRHHAEVVANNMRIFHERRALALKMCAQIPGVVPSKAQGAFYIMLSVHTFLGDEHASCLDVARALLEQERVVTIPGAGFGPAGAGYLRIAYTVDVALLHTAFGRMGEFFARL